MSHGHYYLQNYHCCCCAAARLKEAPQLGELLKLAVQLVLVPVLELELELELEQVLALALVPPLELVRHPARMALRRRTLGGRLQPMAALP